MSKVNTAQLAKLQAADWAELQEDLNRYAERRVRRKKWKSGAFMPKGYEPADIVAVAITKTFNAVLGQEDKEHGGFRHWYEERHPELVDHLRDAIDSEISKLTKSHEHRNTNYSAELASDDAYENFVDAVGSDKGSLDENENEIILDDFDKFKRQLLSAMQMDSDCNKLLDAYEKLSSNMDVVKPQDAASALGWKMDFTYNVLKKVRRAALKIKKEMEGHIDEK